MRLYATISLFQPMMSQQPLPIVFFISQGQRHKQTRLFFYRFSIAFAETKKDIDRPMYFIQTVTVRNRQVLIF